MRNKVSPTGKKVYEIVLGSFYIGKNRKKDFGESHNMMSKTVMAIDVYDALWVAGSWILEQEKELKKEDGGVFVDEVKHIVDVDLIAGE